MNKLEYCLVAHRGLPDLYPENSIEGLAAAVASGARYVEIDVQLSRDEVPVLLHDADMKRVAGIAVTHFGIDAAGFVATELQSEPSSLAPVYGATLSMFADWLSGHGSVTAFVEIKPDSIDYFGLEAVFARVCAVLEPIRDQCVLISTVPSIVQLGNQAGFGTGWVMRRFDPDSLAMAARLAPAYVFCNHIRFPAHEARLPDGGWRWVAYETDEVGLIERLIARGCALVETNNIAGLLGAP